MTTGIPEEETWFPAVARATDQIVNRVSDVLERALGRDPLADKILALADQYESYGQTVLVGPHSVAAKLRAAVAEVRGG